MTHSMLSHYSYPTPHGPITICVSERGVRAVAFGEVQLAGTRRPTELSNRCATELLEYFAGKRTPRGPSSRKACGKRFPACPSPPRSPAEISRAIWGNRSHTALLGPR